MNLLSYFKIDKNPKKGLLPLEWAVLVYMAFTFLFIFFTYTKLTNPQSMIWGRVQILAMMCLLWGVYRLVPCPFTKIMRILPQMLLLIWWYPDTYNLNRIFPNLDYILPLESFKIWGNNNAVKIAGRYKGTEVAYIIDPMSRINLPIDFEFMPNFDLEEYSFPQKATSTKRNNLFTNDNSNKFSSLDSREEWEDQTLDAFEGDESNYWNIE